MKMLVALLALVLVFGVGLSLVGTFDDGPHDSTTITMPDIEESGSQQNLSDLPDPIHIATRKCDTPELVDNLSDNHFSFVPRNYQGWYTACISGVSFQLFFDSNKGSISMARTGCEEQFSHVLDESFFYEKNFSKSFLKIQTYTRKLFLQLEQKCGETNVSLTRLLSKFEESYLRIAQVHDKYREVNAPYGVTK